MADRALFIGWGQGVRGRERKGFEVFGEAIAFNEGLKQEGAIEDFDTVTLDPHGGDLAGFFLLRGSGDQISAVQARDDFRRLIARADLIVEGLGVVRAAVGEGLQSDVQLYQASIEELT